MRQIYLRRSIYVHICLLDSHIKIDILYNMFATYILHARKQKVNWTYSVMPLPATLDKYCSSNVDIVPLGGNRLNSTTKEHASIC